jgi:hypothetical protein
MYPAIALEKQQSSIMRRALGLPMALGGLLVCLTFCFCCARFNDPDMWMHLKLGQEIWKTHALPQADNWSFTVYGQHRIDHEWISQLSIYLAYRLGGYQGLQLWLCTLASAITGLVYALCYRYCGSANIALLGGFLAFFFGTIGFAVRPQLIGYAFLALELLLLERAWSGRPGVLWWLPPLFVVWVNCHGSWALGIGIFAVAALCSEIDFPRNRLSPAPCRRILAGVLLSSCAALAINPIGIKLLLYPIGVFVSQRASLGFLTEWLPLSTDDLRGIGFFAVLAGIGVAGLRNRAKASVFELLVLIPVSFLALRHTRMLFVFGIVAPPIVCRIVARLRFRRNPNPDFPPANAFLLLLAAGCCYAAFPSVGTIQARIASQNPVKAIQFIRQAGLQGNMMHDYMWGGYLAWALPEHKVFIDGRGDIYDWAGVLARYRDWATVAADPQRLLDDYAIRFCLLPIAAQESYVIPHLRGWKKLYSDDVAVIFVRE